MRTQPSSGAASPGGLAPYAWVTLLLAFTTTALVFGIWFSFAVFFVAMVETFHWSRGAAALAFSVGSLLQAGLSPLVGVLTDRWGPRALISAGLLLSAAALAACSQVQALAHLIVFFGFGVGTGVLLAGPVTHSALLAAWFIHRRGALIGLAFAGMGLGVKALGPLAQYLIAHVGWRSSFLVLAALTAGYGLLVAFALRNTPYELGLRPYGAAPEAKLDPPSSLRSAAPPPATVAGALRERAFWALFLAQVLIPLGIFPVSVHQVAYLADLGFSKTFAAAILGHMGLMSSCGRILFGALSDRLGRFGGVTLSVLCSQLGIVLLLLMRDASATWPLYLYALFFGLGYGARGPIISALAADLFAGRHFGTIFGLISIGHGIGGALGPWFGGYVYDRFGSYRPAFAVALVVLCGVVGCLWVATRRLAYRAKPAHADS
ncbi:MAG: MFS transporter [Candidatus Tectimicrobiota bacterium]|nr:MAG: MFS transporter [Candidatus Tectomicrobia bacterium]